MVCAQTKQSLPLKRFAEYSHRERLKIPPSWLLTLHTTFPAFLSAHWSILRIHYTVFSLTNPDLFSYGKKAIKGKSQLQPRLLCGKRPTMHRG